MLRSLCLLLFIAFILIMIAAAMLLLLEWYTRPPLPPRPMFHILNTEEIRGFRGPDWHIGLSLRDDLGREMYFDEELNLLLIILFEKSNIPSSCNAPQCDDQSAIFYSDSEHEFAIGYQANRVLVYHRGALVAEDALPQGGVRRFINMWFSCKHYGVGIPKNAQLVLDSLGVEFTIPLVDVD